MKILRFGSFVSLFVIAAVASSISFAQAQTAAVQGTVRDSQNLGIGLVAVEAIGPEGKQVARSDDSGSYRFEKLPPGTYTLMFSAPGFRRSVRHGMRLNAGDTKKLDTRLKMEQGACQSSSFVVWRKSCNVNANAMAPRAHTQCVQCHPPSGSVEPVAEWLAPPAHHPITQP